MSGNQSRSQAINDITNRDVQPVEGVGEPLSSIWATDVFNISTMEEMLSKSAFKAMKATVQNGVPLILSASNNERAPKPVVDSSRFLGLHRLRQRSSTTFSAWLLSYNHLQGYCEETRCHFVPRDKLA